MMLVNRVGVIQYRVAYQLDIKGLLNRCDNFNHMILEWIFLFFLMLSNIDK
jgi:hypothetical protein